MEKIIIVVLVFFSLLVLKFLFGSKIENWYEKKRIEKIKKTFNLSKDQVILVRRWFVYKKFILRISLRKDRNKLRKIFKEVNKYDGGFPYNPKIIRKKPDGKKNKIIAPNIFCFYSPKSQFEIYEKINIVMCLLGIDENQSKDYMVFIKEKIKNNNKGKEGMVIFDIYEKTPKS